MSRFARSLHIAAPAHEVWKALVEVEAWPGWASQFRRIELIDPAPPRRGSRVRIQLKGMLARTWRVTEYDDGPSFTWESSLAPACASWAGTS